MGSSPFLIIDANLFAKSFASGFDGVREFSTELEAEMNPGEIEIKPFDFRCMVLIFVEDVVDASDESIFNPRIAFLHSLHACP